MTEWVEDGETPHPTGGYVEVVIESDQTMYVDVMGFKDRLDGPAVERANGTREWWVNGERHRFDGPAIECPDLSEAGTGPCSM